MLSWLFGILSKDNAVRVFVDRYDAQWLIAKNDYRSPNDARTAWDQGAFRQAA